jgi:hypothetical protein
MRMTDFTALMLFPPPWRCFLIILKSSCLRLIFYYEVGPGMLTVVDILQTPNAPNTSIEQYFAVR